MDTISFENDDRANAELYTALSQGEDVKVFEMCRSFRNGPFHILTIHHDTVLHMATYCKRNNLVVALLRSLPETQFENLTWINTGGNTILHEASTNNGTVEAAAEMLLRAPSLLTMTNSGGETPLFRAAQYGKTRVFKFLNGEVKKAIQKGADMQTFLLRNDKATILHISILSQNFELAIMIAKAYPVLVGKKDGDGLTGLQLLACNPSAFDNGVGTNFFKRQIYRHIDPSQEKPSRVPMLQEIRKNKRRCESAKVLARILVENDQSWKATESRSDQGRTKFHKFNITSTTDRGDLPSTPDTPLLLATKHGCTEIVMQILEVYPQAIEHVNIDDERSVLNVAIKYRRTKIIDAIIDMEHPIRRLRGKIDKKGNSLLHMVGVKGKDLRGEDDIRSPALVLRDDLILFERMSNWKELAIMIAKAYPVLVGKKDGDGLTGLQLLACNPSAFDNGVGTNFFKRQIYRHIDPSQEKPSRVPMLQEIQKNKRRCESAKVLARILVENDQSWKATESRSDQGRTKFHKYNIASTTDRGDLPSTPDTPLLLATKHGCTEIVMQILEVYPQAIEHVNIDDERNVLNVAIKYRRTKIIDAIIDMEHPIRRLRGKIDKKGNSLLHMVAIKGKDLRGEDDIRSPALVLRDDLILFERMSNIKEAVWPKRDVIRPQAHFSGSEIRGYTQSRTTVSVNPTY
ncbi:hypothetical protein L6452_35811 [Arctium lappa]|uniref:Uncharacterized protein n=1 Tax=Arctium lappa TaxID=4217 RepID=A0ACB8Y838_ARCLA|nr:hypothetical protein L6452_35811 [Arctium lappa]